MTSRTSYAQYGPSALALARQEEASEDRRHLPSTLLAVTAFALSALAAASVLTASGATGLGRAALHFSVIAAPVATGIFAVRARRSERFGRLLIVTGLVWSLAVLSESSDSLVYSSGRVLGWFIVPLVVYVMLSFPQGRLTRPRDRALFRAIVAVIVVLYVGSALVSEGYPAHSPWTSCGSDCPPNAFQVVDPEPGFVDALLAPLRDAIGVLLLIGLTVSLAARMRAASAIQKVTTAPVLAVSVVMTLVLVAFIVTRRVAPDSPAIEDIGLAWALCLPALAVAFGVGLLQRRLFIGNVLSELSLALSTSPGPHRLGGALRSSIGDPTIDVLVRDPGHARWLHDDGRPADPAELSAEGRIVREIHDGSETVAALVLDADVDGDDELIDAVVSLAKATLREASLAAELETSLNELEESRRRIATAADVERRRIERDLHDGAQQRLVALRMRLALAEEQLRESPVAASRAIHGLGEDIDVALDEIRSLAHGIYPPLLADRGLGDALRSVARRCPLPVKVRVTGVLRQPPEIESAVYFSCLEALQNVVKHARGATRARITVEQSSVLEFDVADDGQGFDPDRAPAGNGLRNMHDRVESLGGTLIVRSWPGRGTLVRGTLPLPGRASRGRRVSAGVAPPVQNRPEQTER